MEFRNHQARILHQYRNLASGNPFASFLLGLVFLVVLVPFVLLALLFGAIVVILTIVRVLLARLFGIAPSRRQRPGKAGPFGPFAGTGAGPAGSQDAEPTNGGAGAGTVLDVEATVRTKD